MQHRYTLSLVVLSCLAIALPRAAAQPCAILPNAVVGPTLTSSPASQTNRSAVAYNPVAGLYYSVDAGNASFEIDTYDDSYVLVNTIAGGFDYRGCWWNAATAQLEGNGYASGGIFVQNLAVGTSYPMGTGTAIFVAAQPDAQSVAAFDPDANEIIYYFNNAIYRYARATNTYLGTTVITGLPAAGLNWTSIAYVGCPGHEIGIFDYTNKRLLFINKATGAYVGYCQLPAGAPARSAFGMSYSNGIFWLYDEIVIPHVWRGYEVVGGNVGVDEMTTMTLSLYPNPALNVVNVEMTGATTYRVRDMLGRTVRTGSVDAGARTFQIDVSGMGDGTYAMEAVGSTGIVQRSFIVAR